MRTGRVLLFLAVLSLSAPAQAYRSPGGVLQLAQHAAREANLLASSWTNSLNTRNVDDPAPAEAREAEVSSAFAAPLGESELPQTASESGPWFCHGIDCPNFDVDEEFHLSELEGVERRTYDATKWVSVRVKGVSYDKAMYDGFMALFRFISGTNEQQAKIPMTAPVKTRIVPGPGPTCENDFIISFFIPFEFQAETPSPTEEGVYLEEVEPFTVYVASFGGRAHEESILEHAADLASALSAEGVKIVEDYYFSAGYDPPFRLFNRHNEVWLVEASEQGPSFGDRDADYDAGDVDVHYVNWEEATDLDRNWAWRVLDVEYEDDEEEDYEEEELEDYEEEDYDDEEEEELDDYEEEDYDEEDFREFWGQIEQLQAPKWMADMDELYGGSVDVSQDDEEWDEWESQIQQMMQPCHHMAEPQYGDAVELVDLEGQDADFIVMFQTMQAPMPQLVVYEIGDVTQDSISWPSGLDDVLDDLMNLFRLY